MARRILGALLLLMAVLQLSDPGGFADVLRTYDFGPVGTLAVGLIVGELVGGLGLLGPSQHRRSAATVGLVVASVWSILGAQAFARGLTLPNCGCFGVHLAQPLRWWVLLEDVEFVTLAWFARRTPRVRALAPA